MKELRADDNVVVMLVHGPGVANALDGQCEWREIVGLAVLSTVT